jgi:glycerol-3-phosphate acyltransferase PlsY
MLELWGALIILIACPLLGALPLIDWITQALKGRQLAQVGTGNISVSAAFYHGGRLVGILAVLSEALKGIAAVLLARAFFEEESAWELIALSIRTILGRKSRRYNKCCLGICGTRSVGSWICAFSGNYYL